MAIKNRLVKDIPSIGQMSEIQESPHTFDGVVWVTLTRSGYEADQRMDRNLCYMQVHEPVACNQQLNTKKCMMAREPVSSHHVFCIKVDSHRNQGRSDPVWYS